jgi:hypothetical protein
MNSGAFHMWVKCQPSNLTRPIQSLKERYNLKHYTL